VPRDPSTTRTWTSTDKGVRHAFSSHGRPQVCRRATLPRVGTGCWSTALIVLPGAMPASSATYWLAGSDGGVFAFGDATYNGSLLPGLGVKVGDVIGVTSTNARPGLSGRQGEPVGNGGTDHTSGASDLLDVIPRICPRPGPSHP
jgi:hypothetical protein